MKQLSISISELETSSLGEWKHPEKKRVLVLVYYM